MSGKQLKKTSLQRIAIGAAERIHNLVQFIGNVHIAP
jgi:hypothetical protein